MKKIYEHETVQHPSEPGKMTTCSADGSLTVGEIRNALAYLDDDVEITFGGTMAGDGLSFYRFKRRGDDLLQIELNEGV